VAIDSGSWLANLKLLKACFEAEIEIVKPAGEIELIGLR
jgi:hypothetical protein